MQQTVACKRCLLYISAYYIPACCLGLSLAATPSQAAPQDEHGTKHRDKSNAASSAVLHHEGLLPNHRTNDVASYHIGYIRPDKKKPASIVLSMHLDSYDDIKDGRGFFRKRTPQGKVLVKWRREWVTLDPSRLDGYGRGVDSEFSVIPAYTLTVDSPKALPVELKTHQHSLWAVYLNGRLISEETYLSGLSGEVDGLMPYDDQHFRYTFSGGHNLLVLQINGYRDE